MDHTELRITPEQLHDAASALVGTVEGLDTIEQAQARLWIWLQDVIDALIDDADVYATSPQRGFLTRAFADAQRCAKQDEPEGDTHDQPRSP